MRRRSAAVFSAVLFLPIAVQSQVDSSARLMGYAKSSFNGRPLSGVMISVPAARKFVVTDSSGAFSLSGLPPGLQRVRISYEGRQTEEYEFTLINRGTKRINVMLDVEAIDLDPIVVDAKAVRGFGNFYDRKKWNDGFADFFTREDIERFRAQRISDVLRRKGIVVRCNPECIPTQLYHGSICAVPVSVNGMPFWDFDFENIAISDVAGIEVYRDLVKPPGANQRSLVQSRDITSAEPFRPRGSCGSIFIWTR